jgi:hypothetical protein
VKIGLLDYELMSRTRGYAIVAIVIIAAVITPTPDAFTLCLLVVPMVALYEISIWLAWFDARKQKKELEKEENERLQRLLSYENDEPSKSDTTETEVISAMDATEEGEQPDTHDSSPHHDAEDTGRKPE